MICEFWTQADVPFRSRNLFLCPIRHLLNLSSEQEILLLAHPKRLSLHPSAPLQSNLANCSFAELEIQYSRRSRFLIHQINGSTMTDLLGDARQRNPGESWLSLPSTYGIAAPYFQQETLQDANTTDWTNLRLTSKRHNAVVRDLPSVVLSRCKS